MSLVGDFFETSRDLFTVWQTQETARQKAEMENTIEQPSNPNAKLEVPTTQLQGTGIFGNNVNVLGVAIPAGLLLLGAGFGIYKLVTN